MYVERDPHQDRFATRVSARDTVNIFSVFVNLFFFRVANLFGKLHFRGDMNTTDEWGT